MKIHSVENLTLVKLLDKEKINNTLICVTETRLITPAISHTDLRVSYTYIMEHATNHNRVNSGCSI